MELTLKVTGMTCQNCVRHVREALQNVEGAENVHVDLATGLATIQGNVQPEAAIAAVEEEGYQATRQ